MQEKLENVITGHISFGAGYGYTHIYVWILALGSLFNRFCKYIKANQVQEWGLNFFSNFN
jgi:hypothetical protein